LEAALRRLLSGLHRGAMENSPDCAIPYVARVDAGTMELIRHLGGEVVSSADLIQRFAAVWDESAINTHCIASEKLYRIKDRAFDEIRRRLSRGVTTTEYDVQRQMAVWFGEEGLVSDSPPNVSVASNAGNPHYLPTSTASRTIQPDELVLLDLWGKLDRPGAVYADITWRGLPGRPPPEPQAKAFEAVCAARDAATALVQRAVRAGQELRGWQVDRAAASGLRGAGHGNQ